MRADFRHLRAAAAGHTGLDLDHAAVGIQAPKDGEARLEAGEVRVDLDPIEIGDHQERWILERVLVIDELAVGGLAILVLALVLPGEEALLPDVREAVTAVELLGALLERVPRAGRVGIRRRGSAAGA